jgi:hypothetical protein
MAQKFAIGKNPQRLFVADVVEKLVSVEKVGPVEKTDVHNRAIFDDLTSRNVATYLEKIRCRVFQHNRPTARMQLPTCKPPFPHRPQVDSIRSSRCDSVARWM